MVELTSTSASNGTRNWYLYWHRCISSVDVFITTSYGCHDLVERDTLATRALVLQAIEELARTSRTSTELPDLNVGLKIKLQYGGVPKTRRRAAELARALASK